MLNWCHLFIITYHSAGGPHRNDGIGAASYYTGKSLRPVASVHARSRHGGILRAPYSHGIIDAVLTNWDASLPRTVPYGAIAVPGMYPPINGAMLGVPYWA